MKYLEIPQHTMPYQTILGDTIQYDEAPHRHPNAGNFSFSVWLHLFCRGRLSVIHLNPASLWAPLPNPPEKPSSIPAFRVY